MDVSCYQLGCCHCLKQKMRRRKQTSSNSLQKDARLVEQDRRNAICPPHMKSHYPHEVSGPTIDTDQDYFTSHTSRPHVVTTQTKDTSRPSIHEGHTKDGSMPSVYILEGQNKTGASFPAQSELSDQENSMKRKVNMVIIVDIMIA